MIRRRTVLAGLAAAAALPAVGCADPDEPGPGGDPAAAPSSSAPGSPEPVTPAPSPSTPSPEELAAAGIEALRTSLTREQQLAQLLVVGVPAADLATAAPPADVGGVFLAGRSEAPATDVADAAARWQAGRAVPLWVAVDQEGGQVQTLRGPDTPRLPSALEQGALAPEELAALADGLGASLAAAGVTLDLAPVVDVVPAAAKAANEPIGVFDREYGASAEVVAAAAGAVLTGLAAHGVTATLKHFPGLGLVTGNTDTRSGVTDTETTADSAQVALFGALAGAPEAPFVMMSSATHALLDPAGPAVFSAAVVTDLLRGRLGHDGVVITDDVGAARALADVAVGDRAVRAVAAGCTLVLTVVAGQVPEMVAALAARDGADPAFAAQLDAAVRLALRAKDDAGLLVAGAA